MRLLHAGNDHGGGSVAAAQSEAERRGHPHRIVRQPLPLHRLREDHRIRSYGGGIGIMTTVTDQVSVEKRPGVPLIDGIDKVTGKARYTADLDHADALVGRIFRSPFSHADIIRLDVSKARALDGVVAVVTGDDCAHTYGVLPIAMNEYPLARGRVRYRGEPVAAVAAIDAATAQRALDLIEFEVRELPAYYSSAAARAAGAMLLHDNKPGNLEREVHHSFGDIAARFA